MPQPAGWGRLSRWRAALSPKPCFYSEVAKDGRIYVFAIGQRFDAFEKSGGAEIGVAITRPGYGPNGETVVFDSEDAINLYNYKHGLPGEYFPKPRRRRSRPSRPGKFSGLMFGDYYLREVAPGPGQRHEHRTRPGPAGLLAAARHFTYDHTFSEKITTRFRLEMNSNGQFRPAAT